MPLKSRAPIKIASKPTPKRTILVVEDESFIRFDLADALREQGHAVIEAASGDEALSRLASGMRRDLVISDVHMPGELDGLAAWRGLKGTPGLARHPGLRPPFSRASFRCEGVLAKALCAMLRLLGLVGELVGGGWLSGWPGKTIGS